MVRHVVLATLALAGRAQAGELPLLREHLHARDAGWQVAWPTADGIATTTTFAHRRTEQGQEVEAWGYTLEGTAAVRTEGDGLLVTTGPFTAPATWRRQAGEEAADSPGIALLARALPGPAWTARLDADGSWHPMLPDPLAPDAHPLRDRLTALARLELGDLGGATTFARVTEAMRHVGPAHTFDDPWGQDLAAWTGVALEVGREVELRVPAGATTHRLRVRRLDDAPCAEAPAPVCAHLEVVRTGRPLRVEAGVVHPTLGSDFPHRDALRARGVRDRTVTVDLWVEPATLRPWRREEAVLDDQRLLVGRRTVPSQEETRIATQWIWPR
ncbi:MAG: hypothetical protein H6732_07770 [Alphaproteobacteria bacterium]|nr:hypothetical protein [Alphaproteobacteria bacterium]